MTVIHAACTDQPVCGGALPLVIKLHTDPINAISFCVMKLNSKVLDNLLAHMADGTAVSCVQLLRLFSECLNCVLVKVLPVDSLIYC